MKILIDMNVSTEWVPVLEGAGHEAVHWVELGDRRASDREILDWAAAHAHVVLSHDLDFSRLVALSRASAPSVIQVRTTNMLPGEMADRLIGYLKQFEPELISGAIVVVDPQGARARVLPI